MLGVTKKYRVLIIRIGIFFFCVGFSFALFFLHVDCTDAFSKLPSSSAQDPDAAARGSVEYAVLVITSPSNENKRNAIRSTWGNLVSNIFVENGETSYKWNHSFREKRNMQHSLVKVYFSIGTAGLSADKLNELNTENSKKKDMIFLSNLDDKYENLSTKTKLSLVWISENLKGLKYVIKCDDDSFVRVDMIVTELEAFGPKMDCPLISQYVSNNMKKGLGTIKGLYWGYFDGKSRIRVRGSKWQELDWFLCDYYLPYAVGGGYVISRSIVDYIAKNCEFLSCYRAEDVSMAVWTSALDGINRVHDKRFDTEWMSRGCQNDMLVRHTQSIQDMFLMYKSLVDSNGEALCNSEIIIWEAYDYNWKVPPSLCCKDEATLDSSPAKFLYEQSNL